LVLAETEPMAVIQLHYQCKVMAEDMVVLKIMEQVELLEDQVELQHDLDLRVVLTKQITVEQLVMATQER
jgi:hypothetical protein